MKEKGTVPPPYTSPKPSGQAHSVASARTMSRQAPCGDKDCGNERGKKGWGLVGRGPNVDCCAGHGREQQEAEQQQATKPFICGWHIMVRLPKARVRRMVVCECGEAWYSTRNNRFLPSIVVVAARWAAAKETICSCFCAGCVSMGVRLACWSLDFFKQYHSCSRHMAFEGLT